MKIDSNTAIIFVVTIAVAGGAYWYFFTGTGNQPPVSAITNTENNEAQTRFQSLVSELTSISFNVAIFSDPRFTVLVDLKTPIAPEPIGRPDPFALIAGISGK